jgi:hypothetical protein
MFLGSITINGITAINSNPPYMTNVYIYPKNEYIRDPITGPIANPTPVATSARPKYFS